jgi:penicillin-binding protein 1B
MKSKKAVAKKPVRRGKRQRASSKPRVRKPQPPVSLKARLRQLIIPAVIVGALGLYGLFASIDRRVTQRLNSLQTPRLPVIYSAPFDLSAYLTRISGASGPDQAALRATLTERRYSEVQESPSRPGEYSLNGSAFRIFTRNYINHRGLSVAARKETVSFEGSAARSRSRITLEPQVVSYIGSADVRASSFVSLSQMPKVVQDAVIAIEDERFYQHFGIDFVSILRATAANVRALRFVQGGSTLTQQLAKNLFLSPKKTLSRKLLEVPMALSLERHLSKPQLLELYLNEVYLGQEGAVAIHGMPEAASAFFGKKLGDLTADEAATLAGVIKAPSYYNPRRFPERAVERRNIVLDKMHSLGFLSAQALAEALKKPLKTVPQQEHRRMAPFFTSALESELSNSVELDNATSTGLAVYSGLDLGMQRCAEDAVHRGAERILKSNPRLGKRGALPEVALVALEPHSGLVKSWVGGRDFSQSQFNRVVQARRQVGSTIKPFLYLTALDASLNSYKVATATSILEDKPMEIRTSGQKAWNPENFDHDFRGDVTLRYALENSLNMPALYIAERVGLPAVARTVKAFKLAPSVQALPSLALGALDTNLLLLTAAYGALANGGTYVNPRLYISALDGEQDLLSVQRLVEQRVAEEGATFVLTNMLQGVIERGTATSIRKAGFNSPAAGKTGTSDSARDAWFVGFTPNLVAGVWVGFDDNSPMGITGGAASAPIWADFMKCSSAYTPDANFIPPPSVHFIPIDTASGLLASDKCAPDKVIKEVFVKGSEPKSPCPHGEAESIWSSPEGPSSEESSRGGSFWSRFLP